MNDINAAVWAACDTFRDTPDPSIYQAFVLTNKLGYEREKEANMCA